MGSLRDSGSWASWSMLSPSSVVLRCSGPAHCKVTSPTSCLGFSVGHNAVTRSIALCMSTASSVVACEHPATMPWDDM
eukprot:1522723-Pyramimonas_sp.AAC.1